MELCKKYNATMGPVILKLRDARELQFNHGGLVGSDATFSYQPGTNDIRISGCYTDGGGQIITNHIADGTYSIEISTSDNWEHNHETMHVNCGNYWQERIYYNGDLKRSTCMQTGAQQTLMYHEGQWYPFSPIRKALRLPMHVSWKKMLPNIIFYLGFFGLLGYMSFLMILIATGRGGP